MNKHQFVQIKIEPELQIPAEANTITATYASDRIHQMAIKEFNHSYIVNVPQADDNGSQWQKKKNSSLNTSKNKIYKCEICEEEFQRSYQLKRHHFVGVHKNLKTQISKRILPNNSNSSTTTTVAVTNGHNNGGSNSTKNKVVYFEVKPEVGAANGENIVIESVEPFDHQNIIEYEIYDATAEAGQSQIHIKTEEPEEQLIYTTGGHNVYEYTVKVKTEPASPSKVCSTNGRNIKVEPKDIKEDEEEEEKEEEEHQDSQLQYYYQEDSPEQNKVVYFQEQEEEDSSEQDEVEDNVVENNHHTNNVEVFLDSSNNKPIYSNKTTLNGLSKKRMPYERYKCASCSQSFTDLDSLDVHLQQHNGKRYAFKCELCDKYLANLTYLQNHVISHTENKRHKCDVCEVSFEHADLMRNHQVVHKYNVFKCDKCIKSFATKHLYMSHMYKHTNFKPYKCETCHRSFIHLTVLTKHKESDSCPIYIRRII